MIRNIFSVCLVALLMASSVQANVILNAVDSGWYSTGQSNDTGNENYIVGNFGGNEYNNFFVFCVDPGCYTTATLRLYNPDNGYSSSDLAECIVFHEVSTPVSDLVSNATPTATFNDLGSGTVFGAGVIESTDTGSYLEFTLNSAALAALNALDSTVFFAIGGTVTTATGNNESVFGFTHQTVDASPPQLVLEPKTVPEPTSIAIFSVLLIGAVCRAKYASRTEK